MARISFGLIHSKLEHTWVVHRTSKFLSGVLMFSCLLPRSSSKKERTSFPQIANGTLFPHDLPSVLAKFFSDPIIWIWVVISLLYYYVEIFTVRVSIVSEGKMKVDATSIIAGVIAKWLGHPAIAKDKIMSITLNCIPNLFIISISNAHRYYPMNLNICLGILKQPSAGAKTWAGGSNLKSETRIKCCHLWTLFSTVC